MIMIALRKQERMERAWQAIAVSQWQPLAFVAPVVVLERIGKLRIDRPAPALPVAGSSGSQASVEGLS
jgi:hypothetical protein